MSKSFLNSDAFREIFQSMSEGIIIVDELGNIVAANPVSELIFGYDAGALVGTQLKVFCLSVTGGVMLISEKVLINIQNRGAWVLEGILLH